MSKKILVCQHVPYEILGTLNPKFKEHGFRIHYVNFGRFPDLTPDLEGSDGLVILGGPMNVDQTDRHPHLSHEIRMIEEALKRDVPVLGICLGSQLIAKALGAQVGPNPEREVGWYEIERTPAGIEDPLLGHFSDIETVFQWHGDTFEIPRGAVRLAGSERCANQAFRYGDKVYGLQFHLEVDKAMIEHWLEVLGNREELAQFFPTSRPSEIRRETEKHIQHLHKLSDEAFEKFIALFGPCRKYRSLPSR